MMRNYKAVSLSKATMPSVEIAVEQYERSGGNLKNFGKFGSDPLEEWPHLKEIRENEFQNCNAQFNEIFNAIVNNNPRPFIQSITSFIQITKQLSNQ